MQGTVNTWKALSMLRETQGRLEWSLLADLGAVPWVFFCRFYGGFWVKLSKSFEWYSEQGWELEFPSPELIFLVVCSCLLFVWLVTLLKRAVLSCAIFHVCPLKLYSVCLWAYFDLEKTFLNTENHQAFQFLLHLSKHTHTHYIHIYTHIHIISL